MLSAKTLLFSTMQHWGECKVMFSSPGCNAAVCRCRSIAVKSIVNSSQVISQHQSSRPSTAVLISLCILLEQKNNPSDTACALSEYWL